MSDLKMKIEVHEEDGEFIITFPELPGCSAVGSTRDEAFLEAMDALTSYHMALASTSGSRNARKSGKS